MFYLETTLAFQYGQIVLSTSHFIPPNNQSIKKVCTEMLRINTIIT